MLGARARDIVIPAKAGIQPYCLNHRNNHPCVKVTPQKVYNVGL